MADVLEAASEELIDNNQNEAIVLKPSVSTKEDIGNLGNTEEKPSNGNKKIEPEKDGTLNNFTEKLKPIANLFMTNYSLFIALYKIIEDIITANRYNETNQESYLFITIGCLIIPSFMYAVYMVAKFCKRNLENEEDIDIYTVVFMFLKNFIFFIPMKLATFFRKSKFLITFNKASCFKKFDHQSAEKLKSFRGEINIISFFQRYYAGFPQIVLQLYILLVTETNEVDYSTTYMQFLASGLSILALCASVDKVDDGLLSIILSRIGWLSFIFCRCLAIALLTTMIGRWVAAACLIHVLLITVMIQSAAEKSRLEYDGTPIPEKSVEKLKACTFFTILTAFGFQSLIYWPMMFNLNVKCRQVKFFGLAIAENTAILIAYILIKVDFAKIVLKDPPETAITEIVTISLIIGFTLIGLLFLFLYFLWKPRLTEHWKLHLDSLEGKDAKHSGIYGVYYEFFNVSFTLPVDIAPDEL